MNQSIVTLPALPSLMTLNKQEQAGPKVVEVFSIEITRLTIRHRRARELAPESIQDLANSLQVHGQQHPIIVVGAEQEGEWIVVSGARRSLAAQVLGWDKINAAVYSGDDVEIWAFAENVHRADWHPVVRAALVAKLAEEIEGGQDAIAARLHCSRTAVASDLAIAKLPQAIKDEALDLGSKISRSALVEVALCNDQNRQAALWKHVRTGASRADVRAAKAPKQKTNKLKLGAAATAIIKAAHGMCKQIVRASAGRISACDRERLAKLKTAALELVGNIEKLEAASPASADAVSA